MLQIPFSDFDWKLSSSPNTRPAAAFGTSVTPGNNTYGSWAEVISDTSVVNDVYGVLININSNNVSAAARDAIVNIGTDPAGGTSYATIIPNLLCSIASPLLGAANVCGGVWYYFPLFIPAGAAIAAQASVNNATVGTLRVWMTLFGLPRRPHATKVGHYVTSVGINTGTSSGTAITPGTTSEGSWTSLGTPTLPHWWWQWGWGVNDLSTSNLGLFLDLSYGDATNKIIIVEDSLVVTDSAERMLKPLDGAYAEVDASIEIFGRAQNSTTNDSSYSMATYGLGG